VTSEQTPELAARARDGDSNAFEMLVKRYCGLIHALALRMTGDAALAQDMCQETFTRVWLKIGSLRNPSAFPGWLVSIARRICLDELERRNRRMESGEDAMPLENVNPTMPREFDEKRRILEEAMARLSMRDRQLLTLSYHRDLSSDEVATILGMSPGSVRVGLHRARERLCGLLKGREDELLA
jgi:RNA polymerase sigma-70 factor (ECF subfamily)